MPKMAGRWTDERILTEVTLLIRHLSSLAEFSTFLALLDFSIRTINKLKLVKKKQLQIGSLESEKHI